jgi:O-succinylbenzoic acid--CoA ligase
VTVELIRPARVIAASAPPDDVPGPPETLAPIDDARCLAILTTSGTTGRPKGVVLSRRAFLASARASEKNLRLDRSDRWLLGLPIAHVGGLSILTRSLLARSAVVVPGEIGRGQRLDAGALARVFEEQRVTLASLVPTQLEWLLEQGSSWRPPRHLRAVLLGGAAARPSLLARAAELGVPVLTTYGLTEACSQVTTQVVGTVNRGELGSGPPMEGVEVRIENGVIQVRGPTLFDGYTPPPLEPVFSDGGWFATNDLGHLDANGNLHVVGRVSDLVITGGENVHPAEVEAVVERCPGIAAACVFGVPDDTWGEILAVAIVAAPGGPPSDTELAAFVRAELSPHRRPRRLAVVDALAATPMGKLDRAETRRRSLGSLRPL